METESIRIGIEEIEGLDARVNRKGNAWHVFGKDPVAGYLVVDDGCAGNWHSAGLLAKLITGGVRSYSIHDFIIYDGDLFAPRKKYLVHVE